MTGASARVYDSIYPLEALLLARVICRSNKGAKASVCKGAGRPLTIPRCWRSVSRMATRWRRTVGWYWSKKLRCAGRH